MADCTTLQNAGGIKEIVIENHLFLAHITFAEVSYIPIKANLSVTSLRAGTLHQLFMAYSSFCAHSCKIFYTS